MEWLAAGIAVVAALAAVWQAFEARRARKSAGDSATLAADHLVEARRLADAAQVQADVALSTIEKPVYWKAVRDGPEAVKFKNTTGRRALRVTAIVKYLPPGAHLELDVEDIGTVEKNKNFGAKFSIPKDGPDEIVLRISWDFGGSSERQGYDLRLREFPPAPRVIVL